MKLKEAFSRNPKRGVPVPVTREGEYEVKQRSDWKQDLTTRQAKIASAEAKVKACRTTLYDVVIQTTNDSGTTIDSIAEAAGWSVSYLRAMRGRSDKALPRTKTASANAVSLSAAGRIDSARAALEKAEAQYAAARTGMIEAIEQITAPTPTMSDVAEVLGISRQRVSQLLDEL